MANFYTLFCEEIKCPNAGTAHSIVGEAEKEMTRMGESLLQDSPYVVFPIWVADHGDDDGVPDLRLSVYGESIVFSHYDSGDLDAACEFVAYALRRLGLPSLVFGFANTCSRPMPGAYCGGSVEVWADGTVEYS